MSSCRIPLVYIIPLPPVSEFKCYCGLANRDNKRNRIFRGNTTMKNEYPWMVMVSFSTKYLGPGSCGGSLINSMWVLTAGHCLEDPSNNWELIDKSNVTVHLGIHDKKIPVEDEDTRISLNISEIIMHPEKKKRHVVFDFALLKLDKEISFMAHPKIRPVCLPDNNSEDFAGQDATLTGWGLIGPLIG